MKSKRGTVWINLGLLLLAAALFLTAYNRMASYEAGETSRQVIEQLCETLPTESAAETEAPAIPEYLLDAGREMPVQTIGGKELHWRADHPVAGAGAAGDQPVGLRRAEGGALPLFWLPLSEQSDHLRPQFCHPFRQAEKPPGR